MARMFGSFFFALWAYDNIPVWAAALIFLAMFALEKSFRGYWDEVEYPGS